MNISEDKMEDFLEINFLEAVGAQLALEQYGVTNSQRRLVHACEYGRYKKVEDWIQRGYYPNLNFIDDKNWSPLHAASCGGFTKIVQFLLQYGADMNFRIRGNDTALHLACEYGQIGVVKLFLKRKADITVCNDKGETPLFRATVVRSGILTEKKDNVIKLLLDYGKKNVADYKLFYKLCHLIMARRGNMHEFFVKKETYGTLKVSSKFLDLLSQVEDVNFPEVKEESLLYFAIYANRADYVEVLIQKGIEVNDSKTEFCERPLHLAIKMKLVNVVKVFIDNGANLEVASKIKKERGFTPLMTASEDNNLEIVNLLLDSGVNIAAKSEMNKKTALHKILEVLIIEIQDDFKMVEKLQPVLTTFLNRGADFNVKDSSNSTPLQMIMQFGCNDNVDLLFEYGVNIDKCALHYAAKNENPGFSLENLIRKLDRFYINAENEEGNAPMHYSATCEILQIFIENGAVLTDSRDRRVMQCTCTDSRYCPIIKYFQKMQFLQCGVALALNYRFFWKYTEQYFTMRSEERIVEFQEEIDRIENISMRTFRKIFNLKDVMNMNRNDMAKYLDNELLKEVLERNKGDFRNEFPHFGFILNFQYWMGLKTKELMKGAEDYLTLALWARLPRICSEKIFGHVNTSRLESLQIEFPEPENMVEVS